MAVPPPPPRRPIGVAILAILIILGGILLTILALLAILAGLLLLGESPIFLAIALVFLILSVLLLAAGFGLWNLRPWAWWLAMIVLVLSLVNQIGGVLAAGGFRTLTTGQMFGLAFTGLIFVYLLAVRGSFRSQALAYAR